MHLALRIPQKFNHSDGSSEGLGSYFKTGSKEKEKKKWTIKWNCPGNTQLFIVFLQESKGFKGEKENWFSVYLKGNT